MLTHNLQCRLTYPPFLSPFHTHQQIFVAASDRVTVAKLADILRVEVGVLRWVESTATVSLIPLSLLVV